MKVIFIFKHDEEFSKENINIVKDNSLKKAKHDKSEDSNTQLKKDSKSLSIAKDREEIKSADIEMLNSDFVINPWEKGIGGNKQKHTDQSEGTVLKKENISYIQKQFRCQTKSISWVNEFSRIKSKLCIFESLK